jgi:hypothetical protein
MAEDSATEHGGSIRMTAEVAIMNQHALVFAADSATTVTHWLRDKPEKRYFKGANKLFQLSSAQPVGLMIFGSATLHSVPWEILIKDFRARLGTRSCDSLPGYAERLFEFVKTHESLFSEDIQREELVDNAFYSALSIVRIIGSHDDVKNGSRPERLEKWRSRFKEVATSIDHCDISAPLTESDIDAAVVRYAMDVEVRIHATLESLLPDATFVPPLAESGIRLAMKRYDVLFPWTGVVIGGYGAVDYFPSLEVQRCYGFLGSRFLNRQEDSVRMDHETPAVVMPFAMTSMINTFRSGISPDVHNNVNEATRRALHAFAENLRARMGINDPIDGLDALVDEAVEAHQESWYEPILHDHQAPMACVIDSIGVTEMAAMAKSLIELESLKERVTQSSESVGGAVDVAAISKHDGFVWIDRKHYFRPELNPGFFSRQHALRVTS